MCTPYTMPLAAPWFLFGPGSLGCGKPGRHAAEAYASHRNPYEAPKYQDASHDQRREPKDQKTAFRGPSFPNPAHSGSAPAGSLRSLKEQTQKLICCVSTRNAKLHV